MRAGAWVKKEYKEIGVPFTMSLKQGGKSSLGKQNKSSERWSKSFWGRYNVPLNPKASVGWCNEPYTHMWKKRNSGQRTVPCQGHELAGHSTRSPSDWKYVRESKKATVNGMEIGRPIGATIFTIFLRGYWNFCDFMPCPSHLSEFPLPAKPKASTLTSNIHQ